MRYFDEKEIRDLINAIDAQDSFDTDEMAEFIKAAVKESDDELDPNEYDDPDRLYAACKAVFGMSEEA